VSRLTRRTVLFTGTALFFGGCTANDTAPQPQRAPSPDELLRRAVAADEARLLETYASTRRAHPGLAEHLAPFVRRHEEHLKAMGGKPSTRATPTPTGSVTPVDPVTAVGNLGQAEAAAARMRQADCLRAEDGELARLLASIAACEALHESNVARV
jgi:hypothetical protein